MEISISIEMYKSVPVIKYEYSFDDRLCVRSIVSISNWQHNEDMYLLKFKNNVISYNEAVKDMVSYIHDYLDGK